MLTPERSKVDSLLVGISQELLAWQCFKYMYFSVLYFLIVKGVLLNHVTTVAFLSSIIHRPGLGDYETPSMRVCVLLGINTCERLSHIYINIFISFIYADIFTKFAENVYGCERCL